MTTQTQVPGSNQHLKPVTVNIRYNGIGGRQGRDIELHPFILFLGHSRLTGFILLILILTQ